MESKERVYYIIYPLSVNSRRRSGTLPCHHFQSRAFRANRFPDAVVMSVESCPSQRDLQISRRLTKKFEVTILPSRTRSKAAIFLFFPVTSSLRVVVCSDVAVLLLSYLPTTRLLLTIRHVIFSGFFCDTGVKNEATAASGVS